MPGTECHLCDWMYGVPSPPSPSDQPRCDRPTRPISDFSPDYPDHALWFTAIRAFPGQGAAHGIVRPAFPRTAAPKTRAPSPRYGAPRRPSRPRAEGQPTGRPPLRRPQAQAKSRSSLWSLALILCQRLRTVTACRPVAAATWSHGMFSFRIRTISRSTGSSVSSAAASLVRNS